MSAEETRSASRRRKSQGKEHLERDENQEAMAGVSERVGRQGYWWWYERQSKSSGETEESKGKLGP